MDGTNRANCPSCKQPLRGEDVNIATGLARCASCEAVFYINPPAAPAQREAPSRYDSGFKDVEKPKGVEVFRDERGLTIIKPWSKLGGVLLLFFAFVWNGMLYGMMLPAFLSTAGLIMGFFFLPFIAAGLFVLYLGIGNLVNKTWITVFQGELKIIHSPLPWRGGGRYRTGDIDQLFVREARHRNRNGSYYTYDLYLLGKNGGRVKLLSSEKAEISLFFERTLEDHLGIFDRRVDGEIQG